MAAKRATKSALTVRLNERAGRLWPSAPKASPSGVIGTIYNAPARGNEVRIPRFVQASFSIRGDMLAGVDEKGRVAVLNLVRNRYKVLAQGVRAAAAVQFCPLHKSLLVVSHTDGQIRCIDVDSEAQVATLRAHRHAATSLSFDASGGVLLSASAEAVVLWDARHWQRLRTLSGSAAAGFSPLGDLVVACYRNDTIFLWSATTFDLVAMLRPPQQTRRPAQLRCWDLSPDDRLLLAGGSGGQVFLWDLTCQRLLISVDVPETLGALLQVRFLPDPQHFALLGDGGAVWLCSLPTADVPGLRTSVLLPGAGKAPGEQERCAVRAVLRKPNTSILSIALSNDAQHMAACCSDGALLLWDLPRAWRRADSILRRLEEEERDTGATALPTGVFTQYPAPPPQHRWLTAHVGGVRAPPVAPAPAAAAAAGDHDQDEHQGPRAHPQYHQHDEQEQQHREWPPSAQPHQQRWHEAAASGPPEEGVAPPDALQHRVPRAQAERAARELVQQVHDDVTTSTRAIEEAQRRTTTAAGATVPSQRRQPRAATQRHAWAEAPGSSLPAGALAPQPVAVEAEAGALRRLAAGAGLDRSVSEERLKALLARYGEYPARFRMLVWRFLLRLPENSQAFARLVERGVPPAMADVPSRFPLRDSTLSHRLQRCLGALGQWAPPLCHLSFLPALCFPFVKLFGSDELSAFEAVVTLLLHWCRGWLATFPVPPIPLLASGAALVRHHDPALAAHFDRIAASPQDYLWPLLRSLLTEVLEKGDWLRLWDHLFSSPEHPHLLLFAAVAYLKCCRAALLACDSLSAAAVVLRSPRAIDMGKLLSVMYSTRDHTPPRLLPDSFSADPLHMATLAVAVGEAEAPAPAEGSHEGPGDARTSTFPLPPGDYPPLGEYPKFVVDFQMREWERLHAEEAEVARKRGVVTGLEQRTVALHQALESWRTRQLHLAEAERERRVAAAAKEEKLLQERRRLDALARARRLQVLHQLEAAAESTLANQERLNELEAARLEDELARKERELRYEAEAMTEAELLLSLEQQAALRAAEVQAEAEAAELLRSARAEDAAREAEAEATRRRARESTRAEEEAARTAQQLAQQKAAKLARVRAALRQQQEQRQRRAAADVQTATAAADAERERRVRHVVAQAGMETVEELQEATRRAEEALREQERQQEATLASMQMWSDEQTRELLQRLEKEQAAHTEELRQRAQRLAGLEQQQRLRAAEQVAREGQQAALQQALRREQEVGRTLSRWTEQRVEAEARERALLLREAEMRQREAFKRVLESEANAVIATERTRLHQLAQRLRRDGGARLHEEEETRLQALADAIADKERQVWLQREQMREHARGARSGAGGDSAAARAVGAAARVDSPVSVVTTTSLSTPPPLSASAAAALRQRGGPPSTATSSATGSTGGTAAGASSSSSSSSPSLSHAPRPPQSGPGSLQLEAEAVLRRHRLQRRKELHQASAIAAASGDVPDVGMF